MPEYKAECPNCRKVIVLRSKRKLEVAGLNCPWCKTLVMVKDLVPEGEVVQQPDPRHIV